MIVSDVFLFVGKKKREKKIQMQTVMIPWVLYFYFCTGEFLHYLDPMVVEIKGQLLEYYLKGKKKKKGFYVTSFLFLSQS